MDAPEAVGEILPVRNVHGLDLEPSSFESDTAWAAWLAENHGASSGVWLRLAKKSSKASSVSYAQAIDVALCYGWIDGQKKSDSEQYWLQRFTPRTRTSIWSKINRQKTLALIASGEMKAAGLKEVERAQSDGRWKDAYDSARSATVPSDLQVALNLNAKAKAFFATLKGQNRYAVLFRIQTAKKPETRAKRIQMFVEMLEKHETLHPLISSPDPREAYPFLPADCLRQPLNSNVRLLGGHPLSLSILSASATIKVSPMRMSKISSLAHMPGDRNSSCRVKARPAILFLLNIGQPKARRYHPRCGYPGSSWH